jgi:hypothetical protein
MKVICQHRGPQPISFELCQLGLLLALPEFNISIGVFTMTIF